MRDVLIESATFNKTSVRRTAQKLKMSTEASFRFTRGIPSRLAEIAARRAAKLLVEVGGGRIVPGVVDRYPVPQEQVTVYLSPSQVRRTLGITLTLDEIARTLSRLEFVVEKRASSRADAGEGATALFVEPKEDVLKCAVPWYRLDVRIPADLTEEIARLRGFDNIATTQLSEPLPARMKIPSIAPKNWFATSSSAAACRRRSITRSQRRRITRSLVSSQQTQNTSRWKIRCRSIGVSCGDR